ncbi:MAG: TonB-dependent receptor [Candidatus Azotimanducaceae bacterium]
MIFPNVWSRKLGLILGLVVPLCAANAYAEMIEEVVVTAELRAVALSEAAGSISLLTPDDRADVVNHLEEVLAQAVNVNIASGASRARFVQMRGIGERGQFAEPLNASVGLQIDGVDFSGIGTAATLFDVSQIEVLRGPQGTLYGANALAGLINVVTPASAKDWQSRAQFDLGNYGAQGVGAVISGPLNDTVGIRFSARKYRDDGFIDNVFLPSKSTDNHDESTVRLKLDGRSASLAWQLAAGVVDVANGYDAFSLDNNRQTRSDQPGADEQTSRYLSARFEVNDLDWAQLIAAAGYTSSDVRYGYDEDWTYVGFHPYGYSSTDNYDREVKTVNLDLRWLSKGASKDVPNWVVGIYLLDRDADLVRDYTWLEQSFTSRFALERRAVYGEFSLPMSELWTVSVGARAEIHQADYDDNAGVRFLPEDNLFGSRLKLERHFADNGLGYLSFSQGYKSGGFNTSGTLDADLRLFEPETLWNFEVGYKAKILQERGEIRLALFHMARADVQIATSIVRVRADGSSEFIEFTGNAASGVNQGLEAEIDLTFSERLLVSAGLGLLKTEYRDYVDAAGNNLDGREQAHAPGYQAHLTGRYEISERWFASLALEAKDGYYFSDSHSAEADSYALVNAAIGYRVGRYSARLWGRNLTDADYPVRGFYFGNDPRNGYTDTTWTQLGAPRQVGLSVALTW